MQIKRREHVEGLFILQFHDWAFPMLIAAGAGKLFHMVLARRKKKKKKRRLFRSLHSLRRYALSDYFHCSGVSKVNV